MNAIQLQLSIRRQQNHLNCTICLQIGLTNPSEAGSTGPAVRNTARRGTALGSDIPVYHLDTSDTGNGNMIQCLDVQYLDI